MLGTRRDGWDPVPQDACGATNHEVCRRGNGCMRRRSIGWLSIPTAVLSGCAVDTFSRQDETLGRTAEQAVHSPPEPANPAHRLLSGESGIIEHLGHFRIFVLLGGLVDRGGGLDR